MQSGRGILGMNRVAGLRQQQNYGAGKCQAGADAPTPDYLYYIGRCFHFVPRLPIGSYRADGVKHGAALETAG
jgi:hypothetical protein